MLLFNKNLNKNKEYIDVMKWMPTNGKFAVNFCTVKMKDFST